jgi:hypothetical protein
MRLTRCTAVPLLASLLLGVPALGRGRVLDALGIRAVDGDSLSVELPDRHQDEVRLLLVARWPGCRH